MKRVALLVGLTLALAAPPASAAADIEPPGETRPGATGIARLVLPLQFVSQLSEAAPEDWLQAGTPYCVAAASAMLLRAHQVPLPSAPLRALFDLGRAGNTTGDPGIDPDGLAYLLRRSGGDGAVRVFDDVDRAVDELVGRLNAYAPAIAFTQGGDHAVVVYGYEALSGGPVTALYVADPLGGDAGRVDIDLWRSSPHWMGSGFAAEGARWRGRYVVASYRETGPAHPHGRWLDQSPYPVLARGDVASITVRFRNTGNTTFVRGSASELRLGIVGDDRTPFETGAAHLWPLPDRPALQSEALVRPGDVATFTFGVHGARPGAFLLPLRPVVDGVAWLDDDGVWMSVTVR